MRGVLPSECWWIWQFERSSDGQRDQMVAWSRVGVVATKDVWRVWVLLDTTECFLCARLAARHIVLPINPFWLVKGHRAINGGARISAQAAWLESFKIIGSHMCYKEQRLLLVTLMSLEFFSIFLKDFIYLFLERGEGGRKRERNIVVWEKNQSVASCVSPTGNLACNLGMCSDQELNQNPFGLGRCSNHWATPARAGIFKMICFDFIIGHLFLWLISITHLYIHYGFFLVSLCRSYLYGLTK